MAAFKRFEDIESWQLAREFCKMISVFIQREEFSRDYKLKDQINSSSGSIMDNIAEGFTRGGNIEFVIFYVILRDTVENHNHNYIAHWIEIILLKMNLMKVII